MASLKSLLKLTLTSKEIVTSSETNQCDRVAQRVAKLFSLNVCSTALEAIAVKDRAANRQGRRGCCIVVSRLPCLARLSVMLYKLSAVSSVT